jgi:actin
LDYPIKHCVIENFDDVEKIFNDSFCAGKFAPEKSNIFLTDSNFDPKINREKLAQILFETFIFNKIYICNTSILNISAAGKFSSISIDFGFDTIRICPVLDSIVIKDAIIKYNYGGNDLTEFMYHLAKKMDLSSYLINKLEGNSHNILNTIGGITFQDIKEKVCYCASDIKEDLKKVESYKYELPDGTYITTKEERIICPEALFKPYLINIKENDIVKGCYDSLEKIGNYFEYAIKKDLLNNIILSGGTSLFKGLPERFKKELQNLLPGKKKDEIKVIASPEGQYYSWIGGSILPSISTFESKWITKTEYEENGSSIVLKKCSEYC